MGMQVSFAFRTKIQKNQIIYGKLKADVAQILSTLCKRKGIEIIEAECCKDHVHMLIRIPPKYSVSDTIGYLKGKSSLMIFEKHANLKYTYENRHFWCRGYYVDTVGKNTKKIQEYIANQLKDDMEADQITLSILEEGILVSDYLNIEFEKLDEGGLPL